MKTVAMFDFSGGWNPRDAWSQVADNESPDMLNVTLDERGGVRKRLGLTRVGPQVSNVTNISSIYYSAATNRLLAQVDVDLYSSSDGGASWSASIKSFSTSARVHMVDFLGKTVIIHAADKCFSYDGTTVSAVIANSPKGTCIAVWNNALWSIGDSALPSRVTRSDLGAITWPGSPVTVDLRDKDDQPLTAIGGGAGQDVLGRDGLLAWKANSAYRIHDSATGAYTTVDLSYGAAGPQSVTTNEGITAAISRRGIIALRGSDDAPTVVSQKIEPLFHPSQITFAQSVLMVAGNFENRMVFSLPWAGSDVNNLTLEFSPSQGWFAPHDFGLTCATTYAKDTAQLYGGKVGTSSGTFSYGTVYNVFSGGTDDGMVGTDDGNSIVAHHQTRWFEPNKGNDVRFRRLNVNGQGSFDLYFKVNYNTESGKLYPITLTGDAGVWGTAVWGVDAWGTTLFQDYDHVFSLGHGRSFSILVQESSRLSVSGPTFLGISPSDERGAFAVYGYDLDVQPLGNS